MGRIGETAFDCALVVGIGVLGAGVGAGAGAALFGMADALPEGLSSQELEQELESERNKFVELEANFNNLEEKYGAACVAALKPYYGGGQLSNTDETAVVGDLLQVSGQPCSDSATTVRITVNEVREQSNQFASLSSIDFDARRKEIEAQKADEEDQKYKIGAISGGILGFVFGSGLILAEFIDQRERRMAD